jgi:zinc protease
MVKARQSKKSSVPGVTFVRELGGISEYRLESNGLQILLAPDITTPVAGVMLTYRVGSRNEATGYTGSAHLLEHLLFKGSKRFNRKKGGVLSEMLESKGARVNASTWYDRTNYYEVMPKEFLPTALAYEGDRMRNAYILESDRVTEMPVVRSEFEIFENRPFEVLNDHLWTSAFRSHPYHHPVIGWRSDIENVSIEQLKRFYQDFYRPENATLTIAGDIEVRATLVLVMKEFGSQKNPSTPLPPMYTTESKQEGERRTIITRAGDTNILGIAHKIPEGLHMDMPALLMLSLVLAEGKTSRLYRTFIDSARATDVTTICNQFLDPSLFVTYVTLAPKVRHADAEKLVKNVVEDIQERGIAARELTQAKQAIRAYIATRRDGPYAFLSSINEDIAAGDWARFVTFPEALQKVTAKEVQAAARTYLIDSQSTVGYFVGTGV